MKTPTFLFLHGMWGDARFWNRFRRRFEECGYRTEAVTFLPGATFASFNFLKSVDEALDDHDIKRKVVS